MQREELIPQLSMPLLLPLCASSDPIAEHLQVMPISGPLDLPTTVA